jgi:membrane-bound hydrogenase subunit mbhJ
MMGMKKSPWVSVFNASSCNGCDLEILAALSPRYDLERFGCVLRPSARHADILLVTGPVNKQAKRRLRTVYSQIAEPKKVMVVGECGISGGLFRSYNFAGPVDKVLPVDMYVAGCPPRPEAIINGLMKLLEARDAKGK